MSGINGEADGKSGEQQCADRNQCARHELDRHHSAPDEGLCVTAESVSHERIHGEEVNAALALGDTVEHEHYR